jgi:hypothetical protein
MIQNDENSIPNEVKDRLSEPIEEFSKVFFNTLWNCFRNIPVIAEAPLTGSKKWSPPITFVITMFSLISIFSLMPLKSEKTLFIKSWELRENYIEGMKYNYPEMTEEAIVPKVDSLLSYIPFKLKIPPSYNNYLSTGLAGDDHEFTKGFLYIQSEGFYNEYIETLLQILLLYLSCFIGALWINRMFFNSVLKTSDFGRKVILYIHFYLAGLFVLCFILISVLHSIMNQFVGSSIDLILSLFVVILFCIVYVAILSKYLMHLRDYHNIRSIGNNRQIIFKMVGGLMSFIVLYCVIALFLMVLVCKIFGKLSPELIC